MCPLFSLLCSFLGTRGTLGASKKPIKNPVFLMLGAFSLFLALHSAVLPQEALKTKEVVIDVPLISDKSLEKPAPNAETPTMRGQSIEKGTISTLIIKGGSIHVLLQGKESDKFSLEIEGKALINKKKTCMTIYGHEKTNNVRGTIVVPFGTRIILQGGSVHGTLENVIGPLDVQGGSVTLVGQGRFSKINIMSGTSSVFLQGIIGQTFVHSGSGTIHLGYEVESFETMEGLFVPQTSFVPGNKKEQNPYKASGLRLMEPAVRIKIFLSQGKAELVFPINSKVGYTKNVPGILSFVPNQSKRPGFRVSPYISDPSAQLILRLAGDSENTPPVSGKPQA